MTGLQRQLAQWGGTARAGRLHAAGFGPGALVGAVRRGEITRVRKGHYALPSLGTPVIQAIRVGGALACVDAARHHGLWVPERPGPLHVAVATESSRLRRRHHHAERWDPDDGDVVVHWNRRSSDPVDPVVDAIVTALACQGLLCAFILVESALHLGVLGPSEHARLLESLPRWARPRLAQARAASESGSESGISEILHDLGVGFRQQVTLPDSGRHDFLVGRRLLIEADSKEHHGDPTQDRRRDAIDAAAGYRTLRFMYSQIFFEPLLVRRAIQAALERGDHL